MRASARRRLDLARDDVASATLFLDIVTWVQSSDSEQGLLGLAFDPDFATNRRFFVNYTAPTGCTAPGDAGDGSQQQCRPEPTAAG